MMNDDVSLVSLFKTIFSLIGFIFIAIAIIINPRIDVSGKMFLIGVLSFSLSMVIVE